MKSVGLLVFCKHSLLWGHVKNGIISINHINQISVVFLGKQVKHQINVSNK